MALDTSLISYYKFDESSGNASDSFGSNTLTNTGTATYASAVINNGLTVNGSSQYLQASSKLLTTTSYTVSVWLKNGNASQATDVTVFSNQTDAGNHGIMMSVNSTGNSYLIRCGNGAGNWQASSTFAISTSAFEHYALVVSGTSRTLYRNGISIISDTLGANTSFGSASNFTVGINPPATAGRYWNGRYDEMGLWSRALSADEILQIANSGRGNSYPFTATPSLYGAVAFYNLDDSSGNAVDSTGNGYTLTNNNTITYTTGLINNCATLGTGNTNKYFSATLVDPDSYNSGFSISFWLYFNTVPSGSDYDIFEFQDTSNSGIFMRVNSSTSTTFRFGTGNGADQGNTSYTSSWSGSTWYHIVMVHNATSNTYYVNGSQVAQKTTGTITLGGNQSTLNIGRNTANVNYSNARYDMFGVWAKELSSTEVTTLYKTGTGLQYPFIIALTFAISETLALTESISNLRTRLFSTSETITLTETISILKGIAFSIAEALGLIETFTSTRTRLFTVAESMGLVELAVSFRLKWNAITKSATATMSNVSKSVSNWINTTKN